MKSLIPIAAIAVSFLGPTAFAQTPEGFPIDEDNNLQVTYRDSGTEVTPPGVLLPRSDVLTAPSIIYDEDDEDDEDNNDEEEDEDEDDDKIYVLLMIDQDVPRDNTRVQLLHWLQPNLIRADNDTLVFSPDAPSASSNVVGAEYIPPTPPSGSGPHRYTFLLFEQPANWTIPEQYSNINPPTATTARIGFDVRQFVSDAGLDDPMAANYLRVLNGTASESSAAATATAMATQTASSSSSSSTGAADSVSGSATGTGTGTAVAETGAAGRVTLEVMGMIVGVVGAGFWVV